MEQIKSGSQRAEDRLYSGHKLVNRTGSNNWDRPEGQSFRLSNWWERVNLLLRGNHSQAPEAR
jgi:hypothetical protein